MVFAEKSMIARYVFNYWTQEVHCQCMCTGGFNITLVDAEEYSAETSIQYSMYFLKISYE